MDLSVIEKMILSEYSAIERECVYQVVCAAMIVDGERDPRELKLVEEIVGAIGLSEYEREASRHIERSKIVQVIRNMYDLKRAYVAKLIAEVILADGKITEREEMFFYSICSELNLPHPD